MNNFNKNHEFAQNDLNFQNSYLLLFGKKYYNVIII